MDLKITNNSSETAYFIVWGFTDTVVIDDAPWSYLEQDGANSSKLTALPTPPAKVEGAVKSNVDLLTQLDPGGSVEFKNVPHIISGNILISFKERPKLFAVVPAWDDDKKKTGNTKKTTIPEHGGWGVQSPGFNSGDLDADTIFCSSEFTLDDSGVWADTTNVDYFAAPISVEVNGSAGKQTSGTLNAGVSRDDVFNSFSGITGNHLSGFNNLVMTSASGNVRVLAPGHLIPKALPTDYFDSYVDHCLAMYTASNSLTVNVGGEFAGTYLGTADTANRKITFVDQSNNAAVGLLNIPKNTAQDIFLCNGALSAPNNTIGAITAVICAALNRTVLHKSATQPYCNHADFYSTTDESQSWWATNWYSKLLHDNIGKVYGFAFDDVCNGSTYKPLLHDPNPTSASISLDSWT